MARVIPLFPTPGQGSTEAPNERPPEPIPHLRAERALRARDRLEPGHLGPGADGGGAGVAGGGGFAPGSRSTACHTTPVTYVLDDRGRGAPGRTWSFRPSPPDLQRRESHHACRATWPWAARSRRAFCWGSEPRGGPRRWRGSASTSALTSASTESEIPGCAVLVNSWTPVVRGAGGASRTRAAARLRLALAERMPHEISLHADPHLRRLAGHPRYDALMRPRG